MSDQTKKVSVRLSTDEAWAVVEGSHTGIFTTLRRDGRPVSLPVWFVVIDRKIYVSTPRLAKKAARIKNDSRCSFLVESGKRWAELSAVHLSGDARILADDDPLQEVAQAEVERKYHAYRTMREDMPKATSSAYEARGAHVLVEITPDERFLSWDNARLGAS